MKIKIKNISKKLLNRVVIEEIATKFKSIYSFSPWSEWKICSNPKCGVRWGIEERKSLDLLNKTHCNKLVRDYWVLSDIILMLRKLETRKDFSISIARDKEGAIVGFCWGYLLHVDELIEKFTPVENRNIHLFKEVDTKAILYLAEIAVRPQFRNNGIANMLALNLLDHYKDIKNVVSVTKGGRDKSITNEWWYRLGFDLLAPYNDKRNREVQFGKYSTIYRKLYSKKHN